MMGCSGTFTVSSRTFIYSVNFMLGGTFLSPIFRVRIYLATLINMNKIDRPFYKQQSQIGKFNIFKPTINYHQNHFQQYSCVTAAKLLFRRVGQLHLYSGRQGMYSPFLVNTTTWKQLRIVLYVLVFGKCENEYLRKMHSPSKSMSKIKKLINILLYINRNQYLYKKSLK